jgi:hypothetical protein
MHKMGAKVTGLQSNRVHKREMEAVRPSTVPVMRGRKVGRGKRSIRRR